MNLKDAQRKARNGERFTVVTAKGQEYDCQWLAARRGLFLLGKKRIECDVKGAPHAQVKPYRGNCDDVAT